MIKGELKVKVRSGEHLLAVGLLSVTEDCKRNTILFYCSCFICAKSLTVELY